MRKQANALLKALSDYVGSEDSLRLDDTDMALCSLGGALAVFSYIDETEELVAGVCLSPLPEGGEARESAVRELMRGNYAWAGTDGGVLGLDDETGHVFLSRRFDVANERSAGFLEKTARMCGLVIHWRAALAVPDETVSPSHIIRP